MMKQGAMSASKLPCNRRQVYNVRQYNDWGVGSMGAMVAWAPINISSGITTGHQRTCTIHQKDRDTLIEQSITPKKQSQYSVINYVARF